MTRSQKSLIASARSNTSLICEVFTSKQGSVRDHSSFQKTHSSNKNFKYSKDNVTQEGVTGSARLTKNIPAPIHHRESILRNHDNRHGNHKNTKTLQNGSQDDIESMIMLSDPKKRSSNTYDGTSPLLASRRRRSSIGQINARCRTRSGRASARVTSSGKHKTRPVYKANTLLSYTLSPKLSSTTHADGSSNENKRIKSGGGQSTKSKKSRCNECRKKLNITNIFICRCEKKFCAKHRHAESHSCAYDYKLDGKKYLEKVNPFIPIPKLPKI